MHQVQQPRTPAAPKQIFCNSTGMTYTFKAEGMWGNGLIYATISRAGLSEISLRYVIEFVEDNLGQDISLSALAALTGTGVDVFARNFKASMGLPPYRYVLDRRLLRAQALLMDGGKSIAEIAFELGFSSQAHFTARFSKVMNISPAAYRLRHRR
jgi:AraC family transcriptional regulator